MSAPSPLVLVVLLHLMLAYVAVTFNSAPAFAQRLNVTCGGAGYTLPFAPTATYAFNDTSRTNVTSTFFLSPCGAISSGPCAGTGLSLCQYTPLAGRSDGVITPWAYDAPLSNVNMLYSMEGNLLLRAMSGDVAACQGGSTWAIVQFLCLRGAVPPRLNSVALHGTTPCLVTLGVLTDATCAAPLSSVAVYPTGMRWMSQQCGGGAYDLSSLNAADLSFRALNSTFYWRPCQRVSAPVCAGLTTTTWCQVTDGPGVLRGVQSIAQMELTDVGTWTVSASYALTGAGLLMQTQSGAGVYCPTMRQGNVWIACDLNATQPYIASVTQGTGRELCHYTMEVRTAAACQRGQPSVASSSSAPVIARTSSSSSSSSSSRPLVPASTATPPSPPSPPSQAGSSQNWLPLIVGVSFIVAGVTLCALVVARCCARRRARWVMLQPQGVVPGLMQAPRMDEHLLHSEQLPHFAHPAPMYPPAAYAAPAPPPYAQYAAAPEVRYYQ